MSKKQTEKSQEELVEESRKEHLEFQEWKGKADATYLLGFAQPLLKAGFTTEQVMNAYLNNCTIDFGIQSKETDLEIAKINSKIPEEECDCPECRAGRGEEL